MSDPIKNVGQGSLRSGGVGTKKLQVACRASLVADPARLHKPKHTPVLLEKLTKIQRFLNFAFYSGNIIQPFFDHAHELGSNALQDPICH